MKHTKKMVDHISRLEGQLAAIKRELHAETPDCERVSATLVSAARSFAGLREQCLANLLMTHFIDEKKLDRAQFDRVMAITKG